MLPEDGGELTVQFDSDDETVTAIYMILEYND